jgi:NTE family protein
LVLPGGGARGAYQVGVLEGIASLYGPDEPVPFEVITGTSAGAMNAAYLASSMGNFRHATSQLSDVWSGLDVNDVYYAGYRKIFGVVMRWLWSFFSGGLGDANPRSLLDNAPLRHLLGANIDFDAIQTHIDRDLLRGLAITVAGYASERSLSWFQANSAVQPWWRERREGRPGKITLDHVMASLGLPIIFPAVRIAGEWCGDGSTRQFAPLSPAIHLGAEKLLIIDVQFPAPQHASASNRQHPYPSISRVLGYMLDTIFSDSLYADMERVEQTNRILERSTNGANTSARPGLRDIETLLITPSQRIVSYAARHVAALPQGIRWLLRSMGDGGEGGDLLLSYMLFEAVFCRELIALGRRDALLRSDDLRRFLGIRRARTVHHPDTVRSSA